MNTLTPLEKKRMEKQYEQYYTRYYEVLAQQQTKQAKGEKDNEHHTHIDIS